MVKLQTGVVAQPGAAVVEVGAVVGGVQPGQAIQSLSQATLIELGTPQAQTLPSPASDATTSTKDTVTPSALVSKVKKPVMPRLLPRNDEDKKEEEKTSTVTVTKKPRGRPRKELVQGPLIQGMLAGSELDMDSEDDGDIGAEGEEGKKNKNVVKLSAILPKNMGKGLTPASSSKKGSSLTSVKSTNQKATPKRKRMEDGILDPISKGKKSRKGGGSDSEEIDEMEQIQAATEVTGSGRVRKMKKMFDL